MTDVADMMDVMETMDSMINMYIMYGMDIVKMDIVVQSNRTFREEMNETDNRH